MIQLMSGVIPEKLVRMKPQFRKFQTCYSLFAMKCLFRIIILFIFEVIFVLCRQLCEKRFIIESAIESSWAENQYVGKWI